MEHKVKILVVEDELIIGAKISMQLTGLGYEVTGILPGGEEAILNMEENKPDIVLLDINLKGKIDGIATAVQMQKRSNTPIIYLTANSDEATFNRAKHTGPAAFISKPFKQLDLQRAIELTISRMGGNHTNNNPASSAGEERPAILSDRIFIRHKERMIKIMLADILYLEADRNYSRIFTREKEHLLCVTLKTIEEKLSARQFMRIHRSYIINITQVDELAESHVMVGQKAIPMGAGIREQLLKGMQTL
jgi:DNA-binding LytR/AlgR family response regulator